MASRTNKIISVIDADPEYEVQQILDRKNSKTGLLYLVKWKHFDIKDSTWQPVNNLYTSIQLVKQFQRRVSEGTHIRRNNVDMQFEDDQNPQPQKRKKKRVFKEHLIFPKTVNNLIKKQKKTQQNKKKQSKKNKKIIQTQTKKPINQNEDQDQYIDNFCIQISEIESPPQNLQTLQQINSQITFNQKPKKQQQFQFQNQQKMIDCEIDADSLPPSLPPSLHLTQYQNQQDYKIALQHLNPHDNKSNNKANLQPRCKKLIRLQTPIKQMNMINPDNLILTNSNFKIVKIVNCQGKWFVQIQRQGYSNGYISVQAMQQINISALLDYLYNITAS